MSEPLQEAAAALSAAETIVTMGHIGPDGDSLGSMLAIAGAAINAGKIAYATFGDPFVVGKQFEYLDRSTLLRPQDVPDEIDVAVVVDTSAPARLGNALPLVERAKTVVVIDHHLSQDGEHLVLRLGVAKEPEKVLVAPQRGDPTEDLQMLRQPPLGRRHEEEELTRLAVTRSEVDPGRVTAERTDHLVDDELLVAGASG